MKIHIITEEDPFYIPVFFREFFSLLDRERFTVTGVDITPPLNKKTPMGLAKKLLGLYGPFDFSRLAVRYAVAKAKDAVLPRSAWTGTVARLAARRSIDCRVVGDVNAEEYVNRLRALAPDLLISVAASQIFKKDLLSVPRLDAINIHTGSLPRYRGMLPVFWQMYDEQAEIGITIHTMTVEIDVGEILLEHREPLDGERCLDVVIRKMKKIGARVMVDLLEQFQRGEVTRKSMDFGESGYRSFPVRRDSDEFRAKGFRLL